MARNPKKPHPADLHDARQIATATRFSAHLRVGPEETYTEVRDSISEAYAAAEALNAQYGRFGRRAACYAITERGASVLLTPALVALAEALRGQ